jgi:NAD-dependent SIR2 family protein deacetylase
MLYCGKCKKVTRISMKTVDDKLVRQCKHCGEILK